MVIVARIPTSGERNEKKKKKSWGPVLLWPMPFMLLFIHVYNTSLKNNLFLCKVV